MSRSFLLFGLFIAVAAVLGLRKLAAKSGWKAAAMAAVPLVLIGVFLVFGFSQDRRLAAFASFSDWCTAGSDTTAQTDFENPTVQGKFIPFYDGEPKVPAEVYVRLPGTLRAKTPDEVGAVVCIHRDLDQVGNYQPSYAPAYVRVWHVTVIVSDTGDVVAFQTLRGSAPPKSSPKGRSGYGSKPFEALSAFLAALQANPTPQHGTKPSQKSDGP